MCRASPLQRARVSLRFALMRLLRVVAGLCAVLAYAGCRLETAPAGLPYLVLDPIIDSLFVGNQAPRPDRKSTRLNSSHLVISYAVFCLKKKKNKDTVMGII